MGDYFASGGADNQVMIWKSNFDIEGATAENEIEQPRGTSMAATRVSPKKETKETLSPVKAEAPTAPMKTNALDIESVDPSELEAQEQLDNSQPPQELPEDATRPLTYLPVDLAGTVNNLASQIELLTRTLGILETRVTKFEDHIFMLIKNLEAEVPAN